MFSQSFSTGSDSYRASSSTVPLYALQKFQTKSPDPKKLHILYHNDKLMTTPTSIHTKAAAAEDIL